MGPYYNLAPRTFEESVTTLRTHAKDEQVTKVPIEIVIRSYNNLIVNWFQETNYYNGKDEFITYANSRATTMSLCIYLRGNRTMKIMATKQLCQYSLCL
jgi:hypothetical protein